MVFRGQPAFGSLYSYWLYDRLGERLWIHSASDMHPERPLVVILEVADRDLPARRRLLGADDPSAGQPRGRLLRIVARIPARPSIPANYLSPRIDIEVGPPLLELVVDPDGTLVEVCDNLAIRR